MSLTFIKAGLQSSLQDWGRVGQMHLGLSASGAMDYRSMTLANYLMNKPLNSPVIEVTLLGPVIRAENDIALAICGADFDLSHNGNETQCNQVINLNRGDSLEFKRCKQGVRAYISFSGQLEIPPLLDSYSTHLTANIGSINGAFVDGQSLSISGGYHLPAKQLPKKLTPMYLGNYLVRCVSSLETDLFSESQISAFYAQSYQVSSEANRMGIRLQGVPLDQCNSISITSSGLSQGSIQIPPSGLPIISSVDGQTIGGYPRIANVISADLPLLGQLRTHDKINFTPVNLSYADQLLDESNKLLEELMD